MNIPRQPKDQELWPLVSKELASPQYGMNVNRGYDSSILQITVVGSFSMNMTRYMLYT